jgi:myo-inositol-1(or 4)-monophosphatase
LHDAAADLDLLTGAAEAAGEIALEAFGGDYESWEKPGQGPVTAADLAVDRMLKAELCAARPDYGWLSEESTGEGGDDLNRHARVFIVDPIDGTRAFMSGQEGWGTALAVAERGRVIAGVMRLPARAETYAAALGGGATVNGRPIRASRRGGLKGARVLVSKTQMKPELWPGGPPPVARHFRPSLAWRLCLVAAGVFDAMVTLRDAWEWDIAAGSLIASEAGAAVTDREGGPLVFSRHPARALGVIAAPPKLHAGLMRLRGAD